MWSRTHAVTHGQPENRMASAANRRQRHRNNDKRQDRRRQTKDRRSDRPCNLSGYICRNSGVWSWGKMRALVKCVTNPRWCRYQWRHEGNAAAFPFSNPTIRLAAAWHWSRYITAVQWPRLVTALHLTDADEIYPSEFQRTFNNGILSRSWRSAPLYRGRIDLVQSLGRSDGGLELADFCTWKFSSK